MKTSLLVIAVLGSGCQLLQPRSSAAPAAPNEPPTTSPTSMASPTPAPVVDGPRAVPRLGPNLAVDGTSVAVTFPKTGFAARVATPSARYFVRVREAEMLGAVDYFETATFGPGVEPTATQTTPNFSFYFQRVEPRSTQEWVRAANAKAHTLDTIRDSDDGHGGHELMTTVFVPGFGGRKDFRYLRLVKAGKQFFECGGSSGGEGLAKEAEAFCAAFAASAHGSGDGRSVR